VPLRCSKPFVSYKNFCHYLNLFPSVLVFPTVQTVAHSIQHNATEMIAWLVLLALVHWIAIYLVDSVIQPLTNRGLGPVSRKPRKLFGPVKPFLVHLYLKTEKCIRLKLLV